MAGTWQNAAAGQVVRAAREAMPDKVTQDAFAARLSRDLGFPISASAVSNWETGRRGVPGAVLVGSVLASGTSADALLASVQKPPVERWAKRLGFPERVTQLEEEQRAQGSMLAMILTSLESLTSAIRGAGIHVNEAADLDRSRQPTGTER
jgi:hypothetical protein